MVLFEFLCNMPPAKAQASGRHRIAERLRIREPVASGTGGTSGTNEVVGAVVEGDVPEVDVANPGGCWGTVEGWSGCCRCCVVFA